MLNKWSAEVNTRLNTYVQALPDLTCPFLRLQALTDKTRCVGNRSKTQKCFCESWQAFLHLTLSWQALTISIKLLASVAKWARFIAKRCKRKRLIEKKVKKSQALASISMCGYCFGKHSMTKKLKYFFFSVCKHEDQI